MDAYIFKAAMLCEDCTGEVQRNLLADGYKIEAEEDSDNFPCGPYSHGGGEADSPQHCDKCGVFLENPLTKDGDKYVREIAEEYDGPDRTWSEIAARAYDAGQYSLATWIRFYYVSGR